jgi:uncharacterized protein YndB with AHSA1/START domain
MPLTASEAIEREVHLGTSVERAIAYWLDPKLIVQWMGDRAEIDARPGGRWRLEYGNRYVAAGEILELDIPRRLLLSWGWEKGEPGSIPAGASRVEVTFEPDGAGTRMRLRHFELPVGERAGHTEGWDFFLPRLEAAVRQGVPA